jgi:outer membrane protein assembly factor BamE
MPPLYWKWKFYQMRILLLLLAFALLGACGFPGVYKINVEQGNIVTQEMADQLKPGMTRRQVRFILGTPLIEDTFNQNRWDYLYVKRNGMKVLDESRLTVEFEGDALVRVSGDFVPANWDSPAPAQSTSPSREAAEPAPGIPAPDR